MLKKLSHILIFFCLLAGSVKATHNRAGEITYKRVAPYYKVVGGVTVPVFTYSITIIKYTAHGNGNDGIADRCVDTISFGDNTKGVAPRINGTTGDCNCGQMGGNAITCGSVIITSSDYTVRLNTYTVMHTYSGPGAYLLRSIDPNRNADVKNINNSVQQPFYIESLLIVDGFIGANSSPIFSFPPIDRACAGKCFEHNPGAYDPDPQDSLSFELTQSRGANGQPLPGYFYPETGTPGTYNIHARTGLLTWCTPQTIGEYNLAFIVKEWRKDTDGEYRLIGYVLRDMQVLVTGGCNNDPPVIKPPADTCVIAGGLIDKNFWVTDPNSGNIVKVEGGGDPFLGVSPAAIISNTAGTILPPANGYYTNFKWQTSCEHIKRIEHQATFKATDNGSPIKLVTFRTYNIRVIPPSVKNVTAQPAGSSIVVSWNQQACRPVTNPLTGYKVYRKNDCDPINISPCMTGVPAGPFKLIAETDDKTLSFTDNNNNEGLVVGQNYAYVVIAVYSDGSESISSDLVCAKLKRDVPVILNVDIESTSATGSIFVRWSRPLKTEGNLDTIALPGPYKFTLKHRSEDSTEFRTVFTSAKNFLYQLDTSYLHTNINTTIGREYYYVEFSSGTITVGSSQKASSVFLKALPSDRRNVLQWSSRTPWKNEKYTVWRRDSLNPVFLALGTTTLTEYTDSSNVKNGFSYCYYIESEGAYSDPTIFKPIKNKSQIECARAKDTTAPCVPTMSLDADCEKGFVRIIWSDVTKICGRSDDVNRYILFYKPGVNDPYTQVADGPLQSYVYDGLELISGCYAVQAVDVHGNKSKLSEDFCIDNCPEFELPNIFTPNSDGVNDFYKAIKVRQIKEIGLVIVDRWGNTVYRTSDPYFQWNGQSILTKAPVSDGTYFYICDVYEPRLQGVIKRTIRGYLNVTR